MELLPGPDGQLIEFLRQRCPEALPRTVAIGKNNESVLLDAARDAGVAAVVVKPFNTSDLLSVVISVAGGTRRSLLAREGRYVQ